MQSVKTTLKYLQNITDKAKARQEEGAKVINMIFAKVPVMVAA